MSALGQKQTCALHHPMSALPPIATVNAYSRKGSCPLYPRKRTCAVQLVISALGQKRTSGHSFDYLVGAAEQRHRNGESEGLGSLEIDNQFDFRPLYDWQVGRFVAPENAAGVNSSLVSRICKTSSIAHKTAGCGILVILIDRRHSVTERQCGEMFAVVGEEWIGCDH